MPREIVITRRFDENGKQVEERVEWDGVLMSAWKLGPIIEDDPRPGLKLVQ